MPEPVLQMDNIEELCGNSIRHPIPIFTLNAYCTVISVGDRCFDYTNSDNTQTHELRKHVEGLVANFLIHNERLSPFVRECMCYRLVMLFE